jgi:uncharacterized protein involved in response to NO
VSTMAERVAGQSAPGEDASRLRREPHRLLFPIGAVLGGAGVVPWLVFAFGVTETYRPFFHSLAYRAIFHPLAEVEGFLSCFAAGFVLAAVPRRTGTAPPARWQVALAAALPVATVLAAWVERWAVAQLAWLALTALLLEFTLRRGAWRAHRPSRVAWVPLGLAMGVAGAVIGAVGAARGREWLWLHDLGRGLLLQGLFTALVLGAGDTLLARGGAAAASADAGATARPPRGALALEVLAASAFLASFLVEASGWPRLAFGARAAVTLAAVAGPLRARLSSATTGWRRGAAALATWMLPAGNAFVALAPRYRRAGLHLIYLGCFSALALATMLAAPRRIAPERALARRRQLAWAGALLAVALAARVLLELDPTSFHLWLGTSCAAFLGAVSMGGALALARHDDAGGASR